MEGSRTDSLRAMAPTWTLAGDDMLLTLLQDTHQRILSKCQEVNTKLDEMTSTLDGASIDLQNVNNKFMSLSNRQFIESRVYDDDDDDDANLSTRAQLNKEQQPQQPQQQKMLDDITMIKNSLAILESRHEMAEIVDDSDSDSDVEISVVLKPKDVYSDRPLPYIIGSQQWKNKWHAGLILETSDSDSLPSKNESDLEYSESEAEDIHTDRHNDNTISESSSLQSDRDREPDRIPDRGLDHVRPQPTAAEIAANIASVMAKTQPLIERPVTPPSPKEHIPTKPPAVYRPTQPLTSRVFPDEPPPLSPHYSSSSSQEDIFAEINKNKPYDQGFKVQTGIEDLFGKKEKEDVFGVPYDEKNSYFRNEPPPVKQKPPIKEQTESKSVQQPQNIPKDNLEEITSKKPIGGISLFGSNKHTDTIGAAILKRNKRKSSTSNESGSDVPITNQKQTNMADESQNIDEIDNRNAENDIFENLFAKSNAASNKNPKNNKIEQKTIGNTEKKQNKNLFSDNIFDDVDDIFSSDIKIPPKSNKPSLFDDNDDLFTDIAKSDANISKNKDAKPQTVKSKLFDSDDELFSDNKTSKNDQEEKIASNTVHPTKNDDNNEKIVSNIAQASAQTEQNISETAQPIITNKVVENIPKPKAISIFDSDSDEDIFNFNKPAPKSTIENSSAKSKLKTEEIKKFQSPLLFDDNEVDELFVKIKKNQVDSKTDSSKIPAKELTKKEQEEKKNDPMFNEIESKIKISVETDPLLSKHDKGKLALNIETENTKSFETINQSKENDRQNSDVSNNKKATFKPKAQSSKSVATSPTSNTVTSEASNTSNKLKKPKVPEYDKMFEPTLNANLEITPSDKLNIKTTNEQTNIIHSDNNNKAKVLLSKPEVPIFNEHLFDDIPPPFEPTKESKDNITKETRIFEDPIEDIVEEKPETPIFDDQLENITRERTKTPIIEDIDNEKPKLPSFEDEIQNIVNDIPPEVPIFDNIVTEPPAFEKTKEPKKSKNVNALFDDDSEDEALFFKKNDVISDEKPDVFSSAANFGLFTDEPPPDDFDNDLFGSKRDPDPVSKDQFIGSDSILQERDLESDKVNKKSNFTEKSAENINPIDNLSSKTEVPKSKLLPSKSLFENDSDEDIFSFNKGSSSKKPQNSSSQYENNSKNKESDQISTKPDTIDKPKSLFDDLDDNLFANKTQHTEDITSDKNDIVKKDIDTKKIGKLTTNLNINVHALVPGASPKKTKIEKVDTEPKIVKPVETEPKLVKPIDAEPKMVKPADAEPKMVQRVDTEPKMVKPIDSEPKMVKSISFEEEPESEVLDNNVSKQRAKIQVKRRPSSRKARHEAIRKSALDPDQNMNQNIDPKDQKSNTDFENTSKLDHKGIKNKSSTEKKTISHEKFDTIDKYVDKTEQNKNIDTKLTTDAISHDTTESNTFETQIPQSQNQNNTQNTEKSTKVVYVLNDEDIFTNPIKNNTVIDAKDQTSKSNDVFSKTKEIKPKIVEKTTQVETNPANIEETSTKVPQTRTKLEENTSKHEENLTKREENVTKHKETATKHAENPTKPTKKISLFDSDEGETDSLFKTKPVIKKTKNTKLFDSDSEDDLFSKKRPNVKENDKMVKKSLFDDEDDDLFGAKPKAKIEIRENKPKSSTSKAKVEEKKEKPKTIFADPLSLFGDDDDD